MAVRYVHRGVDLETQVSDETAVEAPPLDGAFSTSTDLRMLKAGIDHELNEVPSEFTGIGTDGECGRR